MPKISVIMPVYNTNPEYLKQAAESILNQTFGDFEFIIINDGSTNPDVEKTIKSYNDKRIIYIYQDNKGIAGALNAGLDIAKGELIARMDSDDISLPERFEKQVKFLDERKDISVLGGWHEYFPKTKIIQTIKTPKFLDFLFFNRISHPTVMFRRLDFEKYNLRYKPDYKCEDYELWSRAVRYLNFYNLQEVLLKYRVHDNNYSKPSEGLLNSVKRVQSEMISFLSDNEEYIDIFKTAFNRAPETKNSLLENILSIKNDGRSHKVITLLGIKIKFKKEQTADADKACNPV